MKSALDADWRPSALPIHTGQITGAGFVVFVQDLLLNCPRVATAGDLEQAVPRRNRSTSVRASATRDFGVVAYGSATVAIYGRLIVLRAIWLF
jgi:hypothetical protein